MAPIGRLIRKIHRHETASTSQPPSSGPRAVATPPRPDQAPIARARSSRRKLASIIARLPGVSSAPPTPCSRRATISALALGAIAQSSEAAVNQRTPTTKISRRPCRSPSDPPSRISDARVSM